MLPPWELPRRLFIPGAGHRRGRRFPNGRQIYPLRVDAGGDILDMRPEKSAAVEEGDVGGAVLSCWHMRIV